MAKSSRSAELRSRPTALPTMSVREFVRGGYNTVTAPVTVMSHGTELGTWYPRGTGVAATFYASTTPTSATAPDASFTASNAMLRGGNSMLVTPPAAGTYVGAGVSNQALLLQVQNALSTLNNYLGSTNTTEETTGGEEQEG